MNNVLDKIATSSSEDSVGLANKLNIAFDNLTYVERLKKLYTVFEADEVLLTSSFGSNSVFLLHLINEINKDQKVHFIDTTYHFKETIQYKNQLNKLFDIEMVDIFPDIEDNAKSRNGQWWIDEAEKCCGVNKVKPLEKVVKNHKVWISGVMAFQTPHRAHLRLFEPSGDIIKFHPLIDIDEAELLYQIGFNKLPAHPLLSEGYSSIGCSNCTLKGDGREGRWSNQAKTECGLHTNFYKEKIQNQDNA